MAAALARAEDLCRALSDEVHADQACTLEAKMAHLGGSWGPASYWASMTFLRLVFLCLLVIWEFPKIRGSGYRPQIVGLLL